MSRHNTPTLGKSHPDLALPSVDSSSVHLARELQRDAADIAPKCNYVESVYGACKVYRRAALAEVRDFLKSVQTFRSTEAQSMLGIPEHRNESLGIVRDQSRLIFGIESGQFGDDFRIVDDRSQNSFLSGRTRLGMAALTVNMGSLTTWLRRRFMATLHSR